MRCKSSALVAAPFPAHSPLVPALLSALLPVRWCWSKLLSLIHWHQLQWITFELSLRCNAFSASFRHAQRGAGEEPPGRSSMHFSFHLLFGTFRRNANINHIILSFYFNSNDEQVFIAAQRLMVYRNTNCAPVRARRTMLLMLLLTPCISCKLLCVVTSLWAHLRLYEFLFFKWKNNSRLHSMKLNCTIWMHGWQRLALI